jgi:GTP-binding protein Era
VTDVIENPEKNIDFLEKVKKMKIPVLLLINKIDQSDPNKLGDTVEKWHSLLPNAEILPISAKNKFGVDMLLKRIKELLPESPAFFDKDQLTDKPARFFVSEIIREKLMRFTGEELPYSVTVEIERFKVEEDGLFHINALILVEREGQKKMVIGNKGEKLKVIGTEARLDMERLFGQRVFLELWVKVKSGWADDERALRSLGYGDD